MRDVITVKLNDNVEVELYFSNQAAEEIENIIGDDVANMQSYLYNSETTTATSFHRVNEILCCMANAAIVKENDQIKYGFKQGEPRPLFTPEFFNSQIDLRKNSDIIIALRDCMTLGSAVSIPDNVKVADPDPDLEELENEKNQKAGDAAAG